MKIEYGEWFGIGCIVWIMIVMALIAKNVIQERRNHEKGPPRFRQLVSKLCNWYRYWTSG